MGASIFCFICAAFSLSCAVLIKSYVRQFHDLVSRQENNHRRQARQWEQPWMDQQAQMRGEVKDAPMREVRDEKTPD